MDEVCNWYQSVAGTPLKWQPHLSSSWVCLQWSPPFAFRVTSKRWQGCVCVCVCACASAGGMTDILEVSAQTPTDLFKSNVQAASLDFSDFTSDNLLHNKKVAEGVGAHTPAVCRGETVLLGGVLYPARCCRPLQGIDQLSSALRQTCLSTCLCANSKSHKGQQSWRVRHCRGKDLYQPVQGVPFVCVWSDEVK